MIAQFVEAVVGEAHLLTLFIQGFSAFWEKAARGGLSGQRFPWGNTISWSQANYYCYPHSLGGLAFDFGTAINFDPTFTTGNLYSSPVGYFAPNGYGLYDMTGNVFQWCWDWWDAGWYSNAGVTQNDTRGPTSGSYRVFRGGSWNKVAFYCRSACRFGYSPADNSNGTGLRSVLPPGQ